LKEVKECPRKSKKRKKKRKIGKKNSPLKSL